jgi:hypothetical protein
MKETTMNDGAVTIQLRNPVAFGSQTIGELVIRPPRTKDLRGLKISGDNGLDVLLTLAGRLSGQPDPVIDGIAGEDINKLLEVVGRFFPAPQLISTPGSDS